jgi:hypothetical protein
MSEGKWITSCTTGGSSDTRNISYLGTSREQDHLEKIGSYKCSRRFLFYEKLIVSSDPKNLLLDYSLSRFNPFQTIFAYDISLILFNNILICTITVPVGFFLLDDQTKVHYFSLPHYEMYITWIRRLRIISQNLCGILVIIYEKDR